MELHRERLLGTHVVKDTLSDCLDVPRNLEFDDGGINSVNLAGSQAHEGLLTLELWLDVSFKHSFDLLLQVFLRNDFVPKRRNSKHESLLNPPVSTLPTLNFIVELI